MNRLDGILADRMTPWLALTASVACVVAFRILEPLSGNVFLDSLSDPAAARSLIDGLDAGQRGSHLVATLLVDSVFPFGYALFFAATVRRCWGPGGRWLALAILAVIPIDLAENAVQALALANAADLLLAKEVLTPAKFVQFYAGAIAALGSLLRAMWLRFSGTS